MKAVSPSFNHPTLHLLKQCKTLFTFKQVHSQMIATGLILHTYPVSRIFSISFGIASVSYSLTIFNQIVNPSIFLYNILISSLAQNNHTQISLSIYAHILHHHSVKPNNYTYPSLFKAFSSCQWMKEGKSLHAHVIKFLGITEDKFVQASLLTFYSRCGKVVTARYIFDQISRPDLATWNSILSAYACSATFYVTGNFDDSANLSWEVLMLFNCMQMSTVLPSEVTLVALVTACADLGALSQGAWAHVYVNRNNLSLNNFMGSALITLYVNSGCLTLACQLFNQLSHKDVYCFNAMIRGLAIHGQVCEALAIFGQMKEEGLTADETTLLSMMSACSHVGMVDEGRKYFESLKSIYRVEPKIEHYCCYVDLLGRAGMVKEAEQVIISMPMTPNAVIWRSLLGATRVHGTVEVGELALKKLVELEPETGGNYVLLSNMYACMDRWDDVKRIRALMKGYGINKTPGCSVVEVDGSMHEFFTGDRRHPKLNVLISKLFEMHAKLQEHGHHPGTRDVMFDIEDKEKKDSLWCHNERVAVAFALTASDGCATIG